MDEKEMLNALIGGSFEKGIRINALVEILTEKGVLTKEEYESAYERNMQKVYDEINEQTSKI
ncbi:hypothetical protein [Kurthia gibsonii]|uniref:hypothetical protein n=1 Tax=Kurthia gibsonii TaxID=33946 RepID=UPI002DBC3CA4|nr:hypothetical protein [Kurthia gibsonii]MEB7771412.1 hypothetical protein [Kurthia gibsonii]